MSEASAQADEGEGEGGDRALLRSVAIAAAMIAGCSVILAALLAWRLLDARQVAAIALAECPCCGVTPPRRGEADGERE